MRKAIACLVLSSALVSTAAPAPAARRVAFVTEGAPGEPGSYGLSKLQEALQSAGLEIAAAGAPADLAILANVRSRCAETPRMAEALAVRRGTHNGKPAVVLCGADSRGLMYAALDTADRVRWAAQAVDPFQYIHDTSEMPYLAHRAVSMYTMQRAYFESRLYDETHWRRYFDMLAADRINSFMVIFGYENGGCRARYRNAL